MSDREREFGDEETQAQEQVAGYDSIETEELQTLAAAPEPASGDVASGPLSPVASGPLSPGALGWVAGALVLAAGGAFFFAVRQILRDRISLLEPRTLLMLSIAGAVTVALAALAWWGVRRLASRTHLAWRRGSELLAAVADLGLESDFGWQDPRLRSEPGLDRFLAGVQERDHDQQQQLARAARLEQEIAQLGGSLMAKERAGTSVEYCEAAVGRVASGATLLYEEIDRLERELGASRLRLGELGGTAADATTEAWRWNARARATVAVQVNAGQRLAAELEKLAADIGEKVTALEEAARQGVPTVGAALAAMPENRAADRAAELKQTAHAIKELVTRGGSLAIQTALEVTRLGERGETLFPLTDNLKALVTDFQGIATQLEQMAREQEAMKAALEQARGMLAAIDDALDKDVPEVEAWRRTAGRVGEAHTGARRQAAQLGELAREFPDQSGRLRSIGGALADLTGVPGGIDAEEPEAEPVEAPPEDMTAATATAAALDGDLPDESARVYDLAEFGAVPLDDEAADEPEDEERIYDLAEFDAVAIG